MSNLATKYAGFRGSKSFLLGLVAFVACWLTIHFIFGLDKDFGALNTILSTEASISLAFFTMVSDQNDAHNQEVHDKLQNIGKSQLALAEAQHQMLVEMGAILKTIWKQSERGDDTR